MFEYGIEIEGTLIAKFVSESDRDLCLTTLMEAFEDCTVEAVYLGD